jgi:hypothetical protein
MTPLEIYNYAYKYCINAGIQEADIHWADRIPPLPQISDDYFLSELAWCVYNAGMKEVVIRNKWDDIRAAFWYFNPEVIALNSETITQNVLKIFNHPAKAKAVIDGAKKIIADGPICKLLDGMPEKDLLKYLSSFSFIGNITKYHLARNIGVDVVKPDRHLVRLAEFLKYESPDTLVTEIHGANGIRKGTIDYVLWQWLALHGPEAYEVLKVA